MGGGRGGCLGMLACFAWIWHARWFNSWPFYPQRLEVTNNLSKRSLLIIPNRSQTHRIARCMFQHCFLKARAKGWSFSSPSLSPPNKKNVKDVTSEEEMMEALGERGQAGYNHRSESVDGDRHSQVRWQKVTGHDKPRRSNGSGVALRHRSFPGGYTKWGRIRSLRGQQRSPTMVINHLAKSWVPAHPKQVESWSRSVVYYHQLRWMKKILGWEVWSKDPSHWNVRIMEEIPNNHLGCKKPCKSWDELPINWCRISSINSISSNFSVVFIT